MSLTGPEKTRFLSVLAVHGAEEEPLIRQTAVNLIRGTHRDAHRERLERLHRFVRDNVQYHREPVEMFHYPSHTLLYGGDCDDHVALLGALAWSLKYPFRIVPVGDPEGPRHYTIELGYPEADTFRGDEHTRWMPAETTIDALPGESIEAAEARLFG